MEASLYYHFPFCASKCRYCDFHSLAGADASLARRVVTASLRSLDALVERFEIDRFPTVYVGGGTPNALGPGPLAAVLDGIAARNPRGAGEWTCELNPEFIDGGLLAMLADKGVDRISVGVQSFEAEVLAAAGRIAGPERIGQALALVRDGWRGRFSVDLIAGLPCQDEGSSERDCARALAFGPDHVSLYELQVEEGTPFSRAKADGSLSFPGDDERAEMFFRAAASLESAGLMRYEVSNFARPGAECLHNLVYWRLGDYVGVGPSAVSTMGGFEGPLARPGRSDGALRISFGKASEGFADDPLASAEVEDVSRADYAFETLMMAMRTREGIGAGLFDERFGAGPSEVLPGTIAKWEEYLDQVGGGLRMKGGGMDLLNAFLVDASIELDGGKH